MKDQGVFKEAFPVLLVVLLENSSKTLRILPGFPESCFKSNDTEI